MSDAANVRLLVVDRRFLDAGRKRIDELVRSLVEADTAEQREMAEAAIGLKLDGVFRLMRSLIAEMERIRNVPVALELPLAAPPEVACEISVERGIALDDVSEATVRELQCRAAAAGVSFEAYCEAVLTRAASGRAPSVDLSSAGIFSDEALV